MSEQSSGLRFDIYERVHLPEHVVGIKELEEIELSPDIHVEHQTEQTVLKGNLRLSGRYVGDTERGESQVLEYFIPVEITLPAGRSQILDELGAEIENFDIDVMDAKSLNVTGVLSLKGLDVSPANRQQWQEEEVVFIHEARDETQPAKPVKPVQPAQPVKAQLTQPAQPFQPLKAQLAQPVQPEKPVKAQLAQPAQPAQPEKPVVEVSLAGEKVEAAQIQSQINSSEPIPEMNVMSSVVDAGVPAETEVVDVLGEVSDESVEKQEMKIAFGSKKIFETTQEKAYHLKNLLHRQADIDQQAVEDKAAADAELADAKATDDRLEWKSLFLQKEEGEQFLKMRMCIVQKQESLETIAERYSLNPREIILFNRLGDSDVTEGQVIYIPK